MRAGLKFTSVAAVIVTYGNRLPLVEKVIAYLDTEPLVSHIVLVDNGSQPSIKREDIATAKPVRLISQPHNAGSAAGFGAGLAEARTLDGVDHILLLDDDNVCVDGYGVARLIELAHSIEPGERVVIAALRQDRLEYRQLLALPDKEQVVPNSFLGFHIRELPRKLARGSSRQAVAPMDSSVSVRRIIMAPYGGLFLPVSLVREVDLPDPSFVLYSDDHDYTLRLSDAGASIYLTSEARIQDIDQSWSETRNTTNPWVNSKSDGWRVYYSSRNRAYLESRRFATNRWSYAFNAALYLVYLTIASLRIDKSLRKTAMVMGRLWHGLCDGWSGRLGYRAEYRIPYQGNIDHAPVQAGSEV
jgi:GT2 family glycosyltransferase